MLYTRRDFGKVMLATGAAAKLLPAKPAKPHSKFEGVQIGVITYSFRALPGSAEDTLKYCLDCGIAGVELMSEVAEGYAGAPLPARLPTTAGAASRTPSPAGGQGTPRAAGQVRAPGGGRPAPTPEQQAAMQKAAEELKKWRLSVSMDKYKAFRKMYNDAGVKIYAFKLSPTMVMSDQEYDYIWNVAQTLGANHITMELPTSDDLLHRVAQFAARRRLWIAFHTHGRGGSSGFEKALGASKYTALNLDVGHYYGVNGESPVPIVEKYHNRIASLHLKDRKGPRRAGENDAPGGPGPNMPWGQGETPLKEVLQLMSKRKYKFPASIEYEYNTPDGSDVLTEIKKCVQYCKAALA